MCADEWGGGTRPRCRSTDLPNWGADAIFTIDGHDHGEVLSVAEAEAELLNDYGWQLSVPRSAGSDHGRLLAVALVITMTQMQSAAWWRGSSTAGVLTATLHNIKPLLPDPVARHIP